MIFIAHRGNINGPNSDKENHPDYILNALNQGYDVEIDVWIQNEKIYLGHDAPIYEVTDHFQHQGTFHKYNEGFIESPSLWVHCKNYEALNSHMFNGHYFAHDKDDFTLTSTKYIWTYPRKLPLGNNSIAVMPEWVHNWDLSKAFGICSDYVEQYKKDLNFKI